MLSDQALIEYFVKQGIDVNRLAPVDIVLALLRMGRTSEAEALAGVQITRCPDYIPLWPPKPVQRKKHGASVASTVPNPCVPTSDMYRRYALVKVGMTKQELKDKGVSARDLVEWERRGMIKWEASQT